MGRSMNIHLVMCAFFMCSAVQAMHSNELDFSDPYLLGPHRNSRDLRAKPVSFEDLAQAQVTVAQLKRAHIDAWHTDAVYGGREAVNGIIIELIDYMYYLNAKFPHMTFDEKGLLIQKLRSRNERIIEARIELSRNK